MGRWPSTDRRRSIAFTLVELIIVVVIIAIIASIAMSRMSVGSATTNDSIYRQNLSILRKAIDRYWADHGRYPTVDPLSGNRTTIMLQLTQYTDIAGNTSATKSATFKFPPYLKKIPSLNVSPRSGRDKINTSDVASVGWIYDPSTGEIHGNTAAATDAAGVLYSSY